MANKLKIVMTTWHTPHQYDLMSALKDDADFFVIENMNKHWLGRPLPENAKMIPFYEKGKYDIAILNIDQQCVNTGIYKSKVLPQIQSTITDIPVIIINHGSPVYPEFLQQHFMSAKDAEIVCKKKIKEIVGDRVMVVNSHTGATDKEWGWGHPIIHGMNPEIWKPAPIKEPWIITSLSPAGCDEYYNRAMMVEVGNILKRKYGHELQWARVSDNCVFDSHEAYAEWMGKAAIYLDTSVRTPMNRARTEAMLSECAVVQVAGGHDINRFFKDKENIFLVENGDPEKMADFVYDLIENHWDEVIQVGKNARQNAIKHFNYTRYRQDWLTLLNKVLSK
jgi:glycosyltransferase involved in cell wall biosynthesis